MSCSEKSRITPRRSLSFINSSNIRSSLSVQSASCPPSHRNRRDTHQTSFRRAADSSASVCRHAVPLIDTPLPVLFSRVCTVEPHNLSRRRGENASIEWTCTTTYLPTHLCPPISNLASEDSLAKVKLKIQEDLSHRASTGLRCLDPFAHFLTRRIPASRNTNAQEMTLPSPSLNCHRRSRYKAADNELSYGLFVSSADVTADSTSDFDELYSNFGLAVLFEFVRDAQIILIDRVYR
ncbi:hypothetical protein BLNAU_12057 [Blattamonas nauphoetae]|uniref:Uncharacterized protein n=1 Tax=Blattamonas nauphoetae TaxID=2049346 RepID=A0ABQ9XKX0_9EUKA|nr:hypothetical protein BLNAU_12057 [Blattamonas nauphoetae]